MALTVSWQHVHNRLVSMKKAMFTFSLLSVIVVTYKLLQSKKLNWEDTRTTCESHKKAPVVFLPRGYKLYQNFISCPELNYKKHHNSYCYAMMFYNLTGTRILHRAKCRLPIVMDFCWWNLSSAWTHPYCNNLTTGLWTGLPHPVGRFSFSNCALFFLNHLNPLYPLSLCCTLQLLSFFFSLH